jgi:hypothetical protein
MVPRQPGVVPSGVPLPAAANLETTTPRTKHHYGSVAPNAVRPGIVGAGRVVIKVGPNPSQGRRFR